MKKTLTLEKAHTAQFCDSFPPIMDGVGRVAKEYAENIRTRLGPTYVIVPKTPGHVDAEDYIYRFPSIPIPGRKPYRYGIPWITPGFTRRVASLPLELVHSHSPFVAGSLAMQVAEARDIPVVGTFHTKYLDDFRRVFPKFNLPVEIVRRRLIEFYQGVDQVWVPNRNTCDTLREYGYEGPIEVVNNGTDIKVPEDMAGSRARAEEFLGIAPDERMLLYIGQIVYEKNLAFLLNSLKALQDLGTRFRFVFVGEGYARTELEQKVLEIGLEGVQFTGVIRDRSLIVNILSRADILTFPSLYDTSPLVLREAAALGIPSVLLAGSTASEGVEDGVNGFLGEQDAPAYAAKLQRILGDNALRTRVGAGARQTFYRTWGEVADEVVERYADLIRTHKKHSVTA